MPDEPSRVTVIHQHKTGGAFRTGFWFAFGRLSAAVVFLIGGCVVYVSMRTANEAAIIAVQQQVREIERRRQSEIESAELREVELQRERDAKHLEDARRSQLEIERIQAEYAAEKERELAAFKEQQKRNGERANKR
jgi:hypothetical protein